MDQLEDLKKESEVVINGLITSNPRALFFIKRLLNMMEREVKYRMALQSYIVDQLPHIKALKDSLNNIEANIDATLERLKDAKK